MSLYRVKQFFWSVFSRVSPEEMKYARNILNDEEYDLFQKLSRSERKHSIRVSMYARDDYSCKENETEYRKIDRDRFIKVALLHDIGKIKCHLNAVDKSILVILNKISGERLKQFCSIKKVNVYYNHGKIGAEILKDYGYDERFLYLIRNHHSCSEKDLELNLLKYYDDKS